MFFFIFGYFITFLLFLVIRGEWTITENIISIFITIVCSSVASVLISKTYYKFQLRRLMLDDTQFSETIKSLIQEKNEVPINDLYSLFSSGKNKKMSVELRKLLNKKIFSWVAKYDLIIEEDKIMLNSDSLIAIMDELDKFFSDWDIKKKKTKK
ncbi:MAG: hypothetical protein ACFE8G_15405 [Candidatus Hermodarchaeota archaeon]